MRTVGTDCSAASLYAGATGDDAITMELEPGGGGRIGDSGVDADAGQMDLRHSARERWVAPRLCFFSPVEGSFGERSGPGRGTSRADNVREEIKR